MAAPDHHEIVYLHPFSLSLNIFMSLVHTKVPETMQKNVNTVFLGFIHMQNEVQLNQSAAAASSAAVEIIMKRFIIISTYILGLDIDIIFGR